MEARAYGVSNGHPTQEVRAPAKAMIFSEASPESDEAYQALDMDGCDTLGFHEVEKLG